MASPRHTSSGRQRRTTLPSVRAISSNAPVQNADTSSPQEGPGLRTTPVLQIARGSPILRHIRVPQDPPSPTAVAGMSSRSRSDTLPSAEGRPLQTNGTSSLGSTSSGSEAEQSAHHIYQRQPAVRARYISTCSAQAQLGAVRVPPLSDSPREEVPSSEAEVLEMRDLLAGTARTQPLDLHPSHPGTTGNIPQGQSELDSGHVHERSGSPQHRVVWSEVQTAELQRMLDDARRRNAGTSGPPPLAGASHSSSSVHPPVPAPSQYSNSGDFPLGPQAAPSHSSPSGTPSVPNSLDNSTRNLAAPSSSHSGSPDGEVGQDGQVVCAHIVLIPNDLVAGFRASGHVRAIGYSEEVPLPGIEETLFIHSDSVETWDAIVGVSAVIVLPRSRLLKFLVVTSLRSPILSLVVFAALVTLNAWLFLSYEPANLLLISTLRGITTSFEFIAYHSSHFCYLAIIAAEQAMNSAYAVGRRGARYLLVAWLELAVHYLEQLRDDEQEQ